MKASKKKPLPLGVLVPPSFFEPEQGEPTVKQLLAHLTTRAQKAIDCGDPRWEWDYVKVIFRRATEAAARSYIDYLALEMYHLGELIRTLDLLEPGHQRSVARLLSAESKRHAGLRNQGARGQWSNDLKQRAQNIAQQKWNRGTTHSIRLAAMCDLVWPELLDFISEVSRGRARRSALSALPDKAVGLKSWLRPVAPPHATRPGRPKQTP